MPHAASQSFLRELDKKLWTAADKWLIDLPTEAELIAELERERRVIEQKQNGGDT